jgi:hypothetical protein
MLFSEFFHSHVGKAVVGVVAAVFLLACPIALPWIAAAMLLEFGVRHLILAFKELDCEAQIHAHDASDGTSLAAPDVERGIVVARRDVVPARSPMD